MRLDRYTIRDGFYLARDADGVVLTDNSFANRSGWETSFRGGALYELGSGLRLRASAYSGLRLPTLNERPHQPVFFLGLFAALDVVE